MLAALGVVLDFLTLGFGVLSVFTFFWYEDIFNPYPYRYLTVPFLILTLIFGAASVFLYFYLLATNSKQTQL